MPPLEFEFQGDPWVCNGWEQLQPIYGLDSEGDLVMWIEAYVDAGPLWTLLQHVFGVGPLITFAGQGCREIKDAARVAKYRITDAQRELDALPQAWKKTQALLRKRAQTQADAAAADTEEITVGGLRPLDEAYIERLLASNGFQKVPKPLRLQVANRILELSTQLNDPALRQQARYLIEIEIMLENKATFMQMLADRQQDLLSRDDINEDTRLEKLTSLQKTISQQEKETTDLARKHAQTVEAIGANEVDRAKQKRECLNQVAYLVNSLTEYYADENNHLIDGVFTAAELSWLLTSTPHRPAFYRLPLVVRINEALAPGALWNPQWEGQPITREAQRTLAQIVKEFAKVEEARHIAAVDGQDRKAGEDSGEDDEEEEPEENAVDLLPDPQSQHEATTPETTPSTAPTALAPRRSGFIDANEDVCM